MRLNVRALASACGVFTGLMMFLIGMGDLLFDGYGAAALQIADSIYPGYSYGGGFTSVLIGTGYALLDGAIGGALFAWFYNMFVTKS